MNYDRLCEDVCKQLLSDISSMPVTENDNKLLRHVAAINEFLRILGHLKISENSLTQWKTILSSIYSSLLSVNNMATENALKSCYNELKILFNSPRYKNSAIVPDIGEICKLVKEGPWLSLSYKLILSGKNCNPYEVTKLIKQENLDVITHRLEALQNVGPRIAYNYGKHVIKLSKFKHISLIQKAVQINAVSCLTSEEMDEAMEDFDIVVTLEIIEDLRLKKPNAAYLLCNTLLKRLWHFDEVSPDIQKVSANWLFLVQSIHNNEFTKVIRKILYDSAWIPKDVVYYLHWMQCVLDSLDELPESDKYRQGRDICCEILLRALNLLSSQRDPDSNMKIRILSTLATMYPKCNISRQCHLAIFFSKPCLSHYLTVADLQKKKNKHTNTPSYGDMLVKLQIYLQSQIPSTLDTEIIKWGVLREQLKPYLSEEDVNIVNEKEGDVEEEEEGGNPDDSPASMSFQSDDLTTVLHDQTEANEESNHPTFQNPSFSPPLPSNENSSEPVMETRAKRQKRSGSKEGWSCPEELCTQVFSVMETLTTHLKKKHCWTVEECKAFRMSLGVSSKERWPDYKKKHQLHGKKDSLSFMIDNFNSDPGFDNGFNNNQKNLKQKSKEIPQSNASQSVDHESGAKYLCPICERPFAHRHTVAAHVEFRHHKQTEEAMEIAETAQEIVEEEENSNEVDNNVEQVYHQGWYPIVDDFLHDESPDDPNTPQAMRTNIAEHVFETVHYLYPSTTPMYDYKSSADYISSRWSFIGSDNGSNKSSSPASYAQTLPHNFQSISTIAANDIRNTQNEFQNSTSVPDFALQNQLLPVTSCNDSILNKCIQTIGPLDPPTSDSDYEITASKNYLPEIENHMSSIACTIQHNENGVLVRLSIAVQTDFKLKDESPLNNVKSIPLKKQVHVHKKIKSGNIKIPAKKLVHESSSNKPKKKDGRSLSADNSKHTPQKIITTKAHKGLTFEEALNEPNAMPVSKKKIKGHSSKTPKKSKNYTVPQFTGKNVKFRRKSLTEGKRIPNLTEENLTSKAKSKTNEVVGSASIQTVDYKKLIKHAENNKKDVFTTKPPLSISKVTKIEEQTEKPDYSPHSGIVSSSKKSTKKTFRKYSKPSSDDKEERTDLLGAMLYEMNNNNKILMPLDSDEEEKEEKLNKKKKTSFPCSICNKPFCSEFILVCHMRKVHKSKAKTFIPNQESSNSNSKRKANLQPAVSSSKKARKSKSAKNVEPVHMENSEESDFLYAQANDTAFTEANISVELLKLTKKKQNDYLRNFFFDHETNFFHCPVDDCVRSYTFYSSLTRHFAARYGCSALEIMQLVMRKNINDDNSSNESSDDVAVDISESARKDDLIGSISSDNSKFDSDVPLYDGNMDDIPLPSPSNDSLWCNEECFPNSNKSDVVTTEDNSELMQYTVLEKEPQQTKRLAATEAARKISTPEKYGRRLWAEYQDLARLYKKSVRKKVARALPPTTHDHQDDQYNMAASISKEIETKNMLVEKQICERSEFYCWICQPCIQESFSDVHNFALHVLHKLQNIDQYPFRCNRVGCLYGYRVHKNLRKHIKQHKSKQGKKYFCHFCPADELSFTSVEHLLLHEKRVHSKVLMRLSKLRRIFCIKNFSSEEQNFTEHFLENSHRKDHDIWKNDFPIIQDVMDDVMNAVCEYLGYESEQNEVVTLNFPSQDIEPVCCNSGNVINDSSLLPISFIPYNTIPRHSLDNNPVDYNPTHYAIDIVEDDLLHLIDDVSYFEPGNFAPASMSFQNVESEYGPNFELENLEDDVLAIVESMIVTVEMCCQYETLLEEGFNPVGYANIDEAKILHTGTNTALFGESFPDEISDTKEPTEQSYLPVESIIKENDYLQSQTSVTILPDDNENIDIDNTNTINETRTVEINFDYNSVQTDDEILQQKTNSSFIDADNVQFESHYTNNALEKLSDNNYTFLLPSHNNIYLKDVNKDQIAFHNVPKDVFPVATTTVIQTVSQSSVFIPGTGTENDINSNSMSGVEDGTLSRRLKIRRRKTGIVHKRSFTGDCEVLVHKRKRWNNTSPNKRDLNATINNLSVNNSILPSDLPAYTTDYNNTQSVNQDLRNVIDAATCAKYALNISIIDMCIIQMYFRDQLPAEKFKLFCDKALTVLFKIYAKDGYESSEKTTQTLGTEKEVNNIEVQTETSINPDIAVKLVQSEVPSPNETSNRVVPFSSSVAHENTKNLDVSKLQSLNYTKPFTNPSSEPLLFKSKKIQIVRPLLAVKNSAAATSSSSTGPSNALIPISLASSRSPTTNIRSVALTSSSSAVTPSYHPTILLRNILPDNVPSNLENTDSNLFPDEEMQQEVNYSNVSSYNDNNTEDNPFYTQTSIIPENMYSWDRTTPIDIPERETPPPEYNDNGNDINLDSFFANAVSPETKEDELRDILQEESKSPFTEELLINGPNKSVGIDVWADEGITLTARMSDDTPLYMDEDVSFDNPNVYKDICIAIKRVCKRKKRFRKNERVNAWSCIMCKKLSFEASTARQLYWHMLKHPQEEILKCLQGRYFAWVKSREKVEKAKVEKKSVKLNKKKNDSMVKEVQVSVSPLRIHPDDIIQYCSGNKILNVEELMQKNTPLHAKTCEMFSKAENGQSSGEIICRFENCKKRIKWTKNSRERRMKYFKHHMMKHSIGSAYFTQNNSTPVFHSRVKLQQL